jgi:hypothetical protein
MEKRRNEYPAIQADIINTPNAVPNPVKDKGKAVVPANKHKAVASHSKMVQHHKYPTTNPSSKTAVLSVPSQSTPRPPHDSHYKVRTAGEVLSLSYSYSMEEWIRTIDQHIHACHPETNLPDTNSGYQYRISMGENRSREVLISRDLELEEDYRTFLDSMRHNQVVRDPHDQCVSLEKV